MTKLQEMADWLESLSQKERDEFNKVFREETHAKVVARGADAAWERHRESVAELRGIINDMQRRGS